MKKNYSLLKRILLTGSLSLLVILGMSFGAKAQLYTQVFPTTSAPAGWSSSNTCNSSSANAAWKFTGTGMGYGVSGTPDHTPGGGTRYMWVDGSSPYPCNVSVTTADIAATVGDELELSFWIRSNNTNTVDNNTLTVDYFDGATWHNGVYTFSGDNPSWFQATVGLGGNPVAGTGNIKLRYTVSKLSSSSSFYNDIAIDDIELIVLAPCVNPPAAGTVTASTASLCATEAVNLSLAGVINATGLSRQWQDSTATQGWTDIFGATSTVHSTLITEPTWFRCVSQCNSGTEAFSDTVFVDQAPFFTCYCSAGATSTTYGYIEDFEFADISFTSPTGCGQNYTNNTSLVATAFFGNTYNLEAYVNNCTGSTTYNTGFKVWIDYNQNGSFSDPGEEVISQNLTYYQTHGGPISIPSTAATGITGMRVMMVESGNLTAMNPCYSFTWGEVEDYSINIQAPPVNDAGVAEIVTPVLPYCGGDSVVRVLLSNFGSDTLFSATINMTVNGGTATTTSWTGTIPPFTVDTNVVVAGTNAGSFAQGDDIVVYTTNPNGVVDSLALNDTVTLLGLTSGLSGIYNIPGDFATITGAVDTLNIFGTCDTTWFRLATGTYDEAVEVLEFPRYSAGSPVIFQSATGDSADVMWDNTTAQVTIDLNGADYIWMEDLTIKNSAAGGRNAIRLSNGADYNKVMNSHIIGVSINSTSNLYPVINNASGLDVYNEIVGNRVVGGSYGIYSYGVGTTNLEMGNIVSNNTVVDFYYMGLYNYYQDGIHVNGNSVTSNSVYTSMYGIYNYYCNGPVEYVGNHVYPTEGTDGFYMAMYFSQSLGNDPFNRDLIANNILIAGRQGETGTVYGLYMANADMKNIYHNTCIVLDGGVSARAVYVSGNDGCDYVNNIFAILPWDTNSTYGNGNAMYYASGALFESNNNNFYSNGGTPIYFTGAYASLAAYQTATGNDMNSYDVNPNFIDTIAGVLCNDTLDGAGAALASVMMDFDMNMRNSMTPDIGAREFQGVGNLSLGPDTTICDDEAVLMVGAGGTSVTWTDANNSTLSTGNMITVNAGTTFPVSVSYANLCGSASASVSLDFVPNVSLDSALHLCANQTETLAPDGNGSPNAVYNWFPTTEVTSQIDIDAPGVYSVTKSEDGCMSQASITVTQSDDLTLVDAEACNDNLPFTVDASIFGGNSYNWSGGTSTSTAQNDFTASGDYAITASDSFGCTVVDSFSLNVIDVPVAVIANDSHSSNLFFFNSSASQGVGSNAFYFWNFGDGDTSSAANPTHLFPWNGQPQSFTVTLTITNDCGTSETVSFEITSDPLGINNAPSLNDLTIYPNPSNGLITINGEFSSTSLDAQVVDLSGRVVLDVSNVNTSSNQVVLDLQGLAAGSYHVKLIDGSNVSIGQIIIQ
jgi:hypothetical protein